MIEINQLSIGTANKLRLFIESLTLADKQAIALIGPNGAGKTTLIKCLTGIERLNSANTLLIHHKAFGSYSPKARAQLLGYIPQSFNPCWNQTVNELLLLAASRVQVTIEAQTALCRQFELNALLDCHWDILSGGEKVRVLAAMALIGNPPLLVADEPGAALDIKHRLQLIEQLVAYGKQQLAIICLHELDLVFRYFKKVILLHQGQLKFYGETADLVNNPLLDETFGIRFVRIKQEEGYLLYPQL